MRKPKTKKVLFAGFLLTLLSITSCEKTDDSLIDPSQAGSWTRLTKSSSSLPGDMIWKILANGNDLWVAFRGQGLGVLSDGDWTFYSSSNSDLINNYVNDMQVDKNGNLHFATNNGYCTRSKSGEWSYYKDPTVVTMKVSSVKVTSKGQIWLGTIGEGFYVDEGTGFQKVKSAGFENVNVIEEDGSGNIFLGTDNGLIKWNGSNFSLYSTNSGLPTNKVAVLFLDRLLRLWIATDGGDQVCWINPKQTSLNYLYLRNGTVGNYIMDICQDPSGSLWFATWYDGLIRYDGTVCHSFKEYNGFIENDVNCVAGDNQGNLWIGLWSKGLIKYMLPLE